MSPKAKRILTIILAILLYCASTAAILAAVATFVEEKYIVAGKTNTFEVNGTDSYYNAALSVPAGGNVQVTVTPILTGSDPNITYDIIIKPNTLTDLQYISSASLSADDIPTSHSLSDGRYANDYDTETNKKYPSGAIVYTNVSTSTFDISNSGASAVSVTVAAVRHTDHNYFISSYFELQMSETEYLRNYGEENKGISGEVVHPDYAQRNMHPYDYNGAYANLYIISSFTIPEDYEYNAPCYINLINSTVTIADRFTIKHDYGGLFAITNLDGTAGAFVTAAGAEFIINTPSAYYMTSSIENLTVSMVGEKLTLKKYSSADAAEYDGVVAAIKADALTYIKNYLKNCMYNDSGINYYTAKTIELPSQYHGYPITYTFASKDGSNNNSVNLSSDGYVDRDTANTLATLTAFCHYNGALSSYASYSQSVTVIGTGEDALAAAYISTLGGYVNRHQPTGDALTIDTDIISKGVDILGFTKEFCADTGFDIYTGYSLDFENNEFGFRINNSTTPVSSLTFTYSDSAYRINGIASPTQAVMYHPYYTAAGDENVVLKKSGAVKGSFNIDYAGTTIAERDKYIDSLAPQLYIENRNDTANVNVLYIKENGTFKGATSLSPTRFSANLTDGSYIDYNLYFFSEKAMALYNAVDTYISGNASFDADLKVRVKSILISDIIGKGINAVYDVSEYYADFIDGKTDISQEDVSVQYNSRDLLGDNTALFSLDNSGLLTLNTGTLQIYYGTLLLVGKIEYSDSNTNEAQFTTAGSAQKNYEFHLVRQLYSPSDGLGGGNTSYTSGDTFKDTFNKESWMATDGALATKTEILSTGTSRSISQIIYTLKNDNIYYRRELNSTLVDRVTINDCTESPETVAPQYDFFKISWNSTSGKYELITTPNRIPYLDTTVEVIVTITDGATPVEEKYSFIIPGVYHFKTNYNVEEDDLTDDIKFIPDIWIYLRMLQVYGSNDGYLYARNLAKAPQYSYTVNAQGNSLNDFDCSDISGNSKINISVDQSGTSVNIAHLVTCGIITENEKNGYVAGLGTHIFNLSGIEYISNTAIMRFDDLPVNSLAPFGSFEKTALTTLSMRNCGITTAMLSDGGTYPLYKQNLLETVDLSGNTGITSLTGNVLYRTVKTLTMSGCSLESLDGIEESLVQLETVDVSANVIKNFYPLTKISTLRTAHIGGNTVTVNNANGYYGTHGEINICNIVAMIHNGVTVYVEKRDINSDGILDDRSVVLYELYGGKYYIKGEINFTETITAAIATNDHILQPGGYLITLEEEYLAVVINAQFNFKDFKLTADADTAAEARAQIFPPIISVGSSIGTETYTVSVVSDSGGDTYTTGSSVRTYIISVQKTGGGTNETIFREITLTVTVP